MFTNFAAVASDQLQNKKIAIVGVIWPSKKFTDVVDAAVAEQGPGGGAGFGMSSTAADETIKAKLDVIATMFDKKAAKKITAAKNQIGKLAQQLAAKPFHLTASHQPSHPLSIAQTHAVAAPSAEPIRHCGSAKTMRITARALRSSPK